MEPRQSAARVGSAPFRGAGRIPARTGGLVEASPQPAGAALARLSRRSGRSERRPQRSRLRNQVLGQHAGDRRRHFDADLVGFEAGDGLIGRDGLAGLLEPLAEVASVIDSPSVGTLDVSGHVVTPHCAFPATALLRRLVWPSAAAIKAACSGRGAWRVRLPAKRGVAAGILRPHPAMAGVREALLDLVFDEVPGAVVLRFLLRPDDVLEVRHALSRFTSGSEGKG